MVGKSLYTKRTDGRKMDEVRPIEIEVGILEVRRDAATVIL